MNDEEFRADLLAQAASRAEVLATSHREAFVIEVLERLRDSGELPDAEICSEQLTGQRGRKLEIDAFASDEADDSLHLFVAIRDGGPAMPPAIALSDARELGFNKLRGIFEQARDGWLTKSIEESRPLWALARRIESSGLPSALRVHVVTDRPVSERIREIPDDKTREGLPVTFQIWDVTRLRRIHEARSARDDLVVDLSFLPGGGLPALRAVSGDADYVAYLTVVPGEALADIYIRHGSRLLEGNVRTFLGRRSSINKGIANTLAKEPARFFAYNNGVAATASGVAVNELGGTNLLLTSVTDLQIVNGAQTTASLAALKREGKLPGGSVFVPMKLSIVAPDVAADLIPLISRYANSQNAVRASDFFANHAFHRRVEEASRRLLAPAAAGSQIQTHWYYERARGQHLNDQAGLTPAKREQFLRLNPRNQVITKTDVAKVENCFLLLADVACKGAEKAFVSFAENITEAWKDQGKRVTYGDDWFRCAVARIILFRATEALVSEADWYEGGYRAQIVAYACARLAVLAEAVSGGGRIDYVKIWQAQSAGDVLQRQLALISRSMMDVLRAPPREGMNISEWAKQQACRKQALDAPVEVVPRLMQYLLDRGSAKEVDAEEREKGRLLKELEAVSNIMTLGPSFWRAISSFATDKRLLLPNDPGILSVAIAGTSRPPSGLQAERLLEIKRRCEDAGFTP